jgi:tRNA threonylcarbamoyl adenosine modification protein YeaZ
LLILSIDSSQPIGSVTLARGDEKSFELIETAEAHGKFSAQLVPTVKRLLDAHKLAKGEIDVIAAASGPGTFTGLRVGLAAVKALAETLGKPIVTVSVLEALAHDQRPAIAVTEAGKGYWYVGLMENGTVEERHLSTDQLRDHIAQHSNSAILTTATLPDGIGGRAQHISTPISELVARVGARKAAKGQLIDIDQLDANYVRADEGLYRAQ